MKDIQSERDIRNIEIDKVGVKNLRYPIVLNDKYHDMQHTIATINMSVNLPHHFRGTHMSRFIEVLNRNRREIDIHRMGDIMKEMKEVLNAESANLELNFPYFIEKEAPVSKAKSLMEYKCQFIGSLDDKMQIYLGVSVPIITLCPCSKEISDYGAHNQRGEITVMVRFKGLLWLEDVIEMVEGCASGAVYSLLKREDEKYVTEKAYENPNFVEDVVRNVAQKFNTIKEIIWYRVEVTSFESIHNHDAYACLEKHIGEP
ncbi:GTP cyclohydrolase I FolE2 [candidate division KSB1 bacterium]|nr:GTP cyclohydrolase I FolE2 [candidate division KSB1 bacterium]